VCSELSTLWKISKLFEFAIREKFCFWVVVICFCDNGTSGVLDNCASGGASAPELSRQ
jgi:hypothetical protein